MLIASPTVIAPRHVEAVQPSYLEVTKPVETVITPLPEKELTIEEKIRVKAREYHYSENRAVAIAKAESGLSPNARNAHSSASGIYQFIDSSFFEFCIRQFKYATSTAQKNDPDIQINCAVRILADGGENNWSESRPVWGKTI